MFSWNGQNGDGVCIFGIFHSVLRDHYWLALRACSKGNHVGVFLPSCCKARSRWLFFFLFLFIVSFHVALMLTLQYMTSSSASVLFKSSVFRLVPSPDCSLGHTGSRVFKMLQVHRPNFRTFEFSDVGSRGKPSNSFEITPVWCFIILQHSDDQVHLIMLINPSGALEKHWSVTFCDAAVISFWSGQTDGLFFLLFVKSEMREQLERIFRAH